MNQPDRKTYIGGSDAAAILGVSEWKTPLAVYFQKTGQALPKDLEPDPARERMFRRGRLMEPVVVEMLIAEHPIKVTRRSSPENPNRYVDEEHDFLAAEIDFEWEVTPEIVAHFAEQGFAIDPDLIGTIQNGEVKTAHPFVAMKKFGEEGTDEIPIEYAAQAMHGLMVAGRQITMFPVLIGSDNLVIYWVRRDDATIKAMRAKEVAFWQDHVVLRVEPEPVNLPDIYHLFGKLGETRVEADEATAALVADLRAVKTTAKQAAEREELLKFEIGKFMLGAELIENPRETGKHVLMRGGEPLVTVAFQQQYGINDGMVKALHPKVAEECVRLSQFFTFNINRRSKKT